MMNLLDNTAENQRQDWIGKHYDYWGELAETYDSLYQSAWSQLENKHTVKQLGWLSEYDKPRILDLGSGTGLGYKLCSQAVLSTFVYRGVDISPDMVCLSREKYPEATFDIGDMGDLSNYPDNHFDAVISLFTAFSYAEYPKRTLIDAFRVLKPEGAVFISVLSRYSLRRLLHRQFFEVEYYSTRKSSKFASVPAHVFSKSSIAALFDNVDYSQVQIFGQGVFSGVSEWESLWGLDKRLSKASPNLCHLLNVYATKST